MYKLAKWLTLGGLLALCAVTAVSAQVFQLRFTGTVRSVVDGASIYGGSVRVGDPFTATVLYGLKPADGVFDDTGRWNSLTAHYYYNSTLVPNSLEVSVGVLEYAIPAETGSRNRLNADLVQRRNSGESDTIDFYTTIADWPAITAPVMYDRQIRIHFQAVDALQSVDLPTDIDLTKWPIAAVDIFGWTADNTLCSISGNVTAVQASMVPEPSVILAVLTGLAGLGCVRRRK